MAVVGACGGIGQPLALLLKRHKLISKLSIYDVVKTPGVYADLSHIDTKACIEAFQCAENLPAALESEFHFKCEKRNAFCIFTFYI